MDLKSEGIKLEPLSLQMSTKNMNSDVCCTQQFELTGTETISLIIFALGVVSVLLAPLFSGEFETVPPPPPISNKCWLYRRLTWTLALWRRAFSMTVYLMPFFLWRSLLSCSKPSAPEAMRPPSLVEVSIVGLFHFISQHLMSISVSL